MKKILIVDDELPILKSLSRVFFDTDYTIHTAESGAAALEFLKENDVDLIISDMRMPLMDGYELLSRIKAAYPNIIRVILSGYAEEDSIFKALLHSIAKFYIMKPWSNEKLLEYIGQIFETEDRLKSNELLILINNIERLPTIESSYQKILNLIETDEETSFIASEIEKDFAISTKLLQIANSAYYGVQTGSVKSATVYLGLQNLRSLIYATSIMSSFRSADTADRRNISDLWEHALLTNKILHYIYQVFLGKKLPEEAYSAGLLHNIGTLILIQNYFDRYVGIIRKTNQESLNLLELEQEVFHVSHQEVGGYLVRWWELPFPIVESALFHHKPLESCILNKEIVSAVHLAQHYAWLHMNRPVFTGFFPEVFDILNVPQKEFEEGIQSGDFL